MHPPLTPHRHPLILVCVPIICIRTLCNNPPRGNYPPHGLQAGPAGLTCEVLGSVPCRVIQSFVTEVKRCILHLPHIDILCVLRILVCVPIICIRTLCNNPPRGNYPPHGLQAGPAGLTCEVLGSVPCRVIIEEFQKCHLEHPIGKFFGECTELKVKLDRCFRQEKAVKRKVNFERSKKLQERLKTIRKEETAET
ncbi:hypothetical protein DY000_02009721 [Brassica cretica]|uniref:COX assembly mitochondrial protein n=1 Tax=Brassica cretica TaxID=69181 RepID=A0ABQ7CGN1_BRACR|nr:hypothetical protein DY000_02009721 [Brassica cretica]